MPGPSQRQPDVRELRMQRSCFGKRRSILLTAMVCSLVGLALYTLSVGCCVLVSAGLEQALRRDGSRVIILSDLPEEETQRYERDLEDTLHYKRLVGKTLLQSDDTHDSPSSWVQPEHGGEDLLFAGFSRTEEDKLNGYLGDIFDQDVTDSPGAIYESRHAHHSSGSNTSPSSILRTNKNGSRKLPQALIIGVKKGGTRALLEFLRIHPDVRAPGPEAHFFDRHYHRGLDWYRKQMPSTIDDQITMEKTPSYFVTKGVPARIYNMSKTVKFLVVVRDPVTRAISDWTQAASKRTDVRPFEEMAFIDNVTGLVDTSWGAVRIGVYAKHLERWLKYFPLNQIHFINGERLISDPATELSKVQDFLGLKRVINEKHFYFNSTKGFPCLKKPEGSGNPHCLGKTKGRPHPAVDPKVIKRLRDFYRPFNAKFYQMTGIDFGWE